MKNAAKITLVLVLTTVAGFGTDRIIHSAPTCTFLQAFRQAENTNAPMNFWERLVLSYAIVRSHSCT